MPSPCSPGSAGESGWAATPWFLRTLSFPSPASPFGFHSGFPECTTQHVPRCNTRRFPTTRPLPPHRWPLRRARRQTPEWPAPLHSCLSPNSVCGGRGPVQCWRSLHHLACSRSQSHHPVSSPHPPPRCRWNSWARSPFSENMSFMSGGWPFYLLPSWPRC